MDYAFARITGRAAQAKLGPGVEIAHQIYNASAEFAVERPGSITAVLFKGAGGKTKMNSGVGRPQISGCDRRGSGIHKLAPLALGYSGRLPLVAETIGADGQVRGSDNIAGAGIVAPICMVPLFGGTIANAQ